MVPARLLITRLGRREAFAHETPHTCVDDSGQLGTAQLPRGFYRLRDGRVVGNARQLDLEKSDREQCVDDTVAPLQRPVEQPLCPVLQLPMMSQDAVAQIAQQRTLTRRQTGLVFADKGVERLAAVNDAVDKLCSDGPGPDS